MAKSKKENPSRVLLVEGTADKGFYEQVCKKLNLNPKIDVAVPKDYDGYFRNGRANVLLKMEDLLGELIDKDSVTKQLAVMIDADYQETNGLGFDEVLDSVRKKAEAKQFYLDNESGDNGFIFQYEGEKSIQFGLWIMPNNQNDGMLEDFIKTCIQSDEQLPLFKHAQNITSTLEKPKFKPIHQAKAEVATWLAWQKEPGHGLYLSIRDDLINRNHPLFEKMQNWLKKVFTA